MDNLSLFICLFKMPILSSAFKNGFVLPSIISLSPIRRGMNKAELQQVQILFEI